MKWLLSLFILSNLAWAENSKVIPVFLEAAEVYVSQSGEHLYLRPDVLAVVKVLEDKKIDPSLLSNFNKSQTAEVELKADKFDSWISEAAVANKSNQTLREVPEISLHAFKLDVVEESDDYLNDNIYAYYFITDGVIPTGKVTSIYKGFDEGQSFFFNEIDRAIFPLAGIPAKRPDNHLIVDYGIIESDDDDIKKMQQLSNVIVDIAAAVYSAQNPEGAPLAENLRKEIKVLASLLLTLDHDDKLVTHTIGFKAEEIASLMSKNTYVEFSQKHKKNSTFDSWEYKLHFRMIKK